MTEDTVDTLNRELTGKSAGVIVSQLYDRFSPDRIVTASSVSVEDQVLTHMVLQQCKKARVFTLDTGRLFGETYATMERTMEKLGFRYEVYAPQACDLEEMIAAHGPDLFYKSHSLRKLCCKVRKTGPIARVLGSADVWICGLRRGQALTRTTVDPVEWDSTHGMLKANPLFDWSEQDVWKYVKENNLPYNPLQEIGFRSIGCSSCTRAIGPADDIRAGRWWWEQPEHKECGLHGRKQNNKS